MENAKLTDYEGTYARFLEKNEQEAAVMAAKDQKKKELDKSQIKAKSKVETQEILPMANAKIQRVLPC